MTEESADPKPEDRDYATTDEVSKVAGVERAALGEWVRAGLLPTPRWTGGRGIIAKWPLVSLKIAAFVRSQRELGFGLQDIRARIIAGFGEKVLEVLAEPRAPQTQGKKKKSVPRQSKHPRSRG